MASSARIDELQKKFDENPKRYFAPLANEFRKAGDLEQAIALCRAFLPQQPGHMSGHIVFGQALYESGELDESRQVFEAALALDPENLIALRHLGDIARVHGDPGAARRWYERVLEADPRNEEIAGLIGALPGDSADAAPTADGASGWGDVNPELLEGASPSLDRRETPTYTNAAALLDLEEAPTPEPVQPLAGFEATSAAPAAVEPTSAPEARDAEPELDDFPELDAPTPPPSVTESPTVAFQALRPQTPGDFPSIEVEDSSAPSLEGAEGGSEFDLDAFEAQTQYASSGTTGEGSTGGASSSTASAELDDLPALDEVEEAPAAPPAVTQPMPRQQRWDRTPLSMEALAAEPVAEAHAASPADGLETMEFVPPPRDTSDANDASAFDVEVREVSPEDATPAAFVTETMAELYLQQGFHEEALNVYRQLLAQNPRDQGLRERVWQLEHGARSSLQMAALVDPTPASTPSVPSAPDAIASLADASPGPDTGWAAAATDAAHDPDGARPGAATARSFFSGLAARRAPAWYQPMPYDAPADEAVASDRTGVEATWTENGGADTADRDADALSDADAIEPASLDYLAHARQPTPDALPTIADVSAFGQETDGDERGVAAGAAEPVAGGTVDTLFGNADVPSEDERAARTLAGVFTTGDMATVEAPVQGRPTRAAQTEISLDHVFRDSSQKNTPRRSAGFSFDQFFSESAGGTAPVTPAPQANDAPPPDASGDIEQFNAWLEGLKKK